VFNELDFLIFIDAHQGAGNRGLFNIQLIDLAVKIHGFLQVANMIDHFGNVVFSFPICQVLFSGSFISVNGADPKEVFW
jgi:hypothetical protein